METGSTKREEQRAQSEDSNCQKACSRETQLASSASVLNLSGMPRHSN